MTRITQAKRDRAIMANRFRGDVKILGYRQPFHRERKWLEFSNGIKVPVLVSVNQIINVKKAYKKFTEKIHM